MRDEKKFSINIGPENGGLYVWSLFLVLLAVKLFKPAALTWFWVFSPFIFALGIFLVVMVVLLVIWLVIWLVFS